VPRFAAPVISALIALAGCGGASGTAFTPPVAIASSSLSAAAAPANVDAASREIERRRRREPMLYAVSAALPPVVSIYDLNGKLVSRFNASGFFPSAIAVDDDRNIFVSSKSGIRTDSVIAVFNAVGSLVRSITQDVEEVNGLATRADRLYTCNLFPLQAGPTPIVNFVALYRSDGGAFVRRFGGVMSDPQGIGLDGEGRIYVLNGETARGNAPTNSVAVQDSHGALIRTFPVLNFPRRLAVARGGTAFVVGSDAIGENLSAYVEGRPPLLVRRAEPLQRLTVAIDPQDNVYVATSATTVSVYTDEGVFVRDIVLEAPNTTDASPIIAVR
jgi:hypothetical protein